MGLRPGDVVAGRYELQRMIGRGGMGQVWCAIDGRLRREVAVKFVFGAEQVEPEDLARFTREARAAARVSHPGIVTVHDIDAEHEPPYLVMELLAGPSLADLLRAGGALEPDEALAHARMVADALAHAHGCGLVHRDIKPGNLVFDEHGTLKICDFGIVRFHDALTRLAVTSRGMGTPSYSAPEQLADETVDGRADLYSLGCVLFEMLTGRPPFEGTSTAVIFKHAASAPPAPSTLRPDLPEALDRLVLDLLEKRPEDRPTSAREVVNRLDRSAGPASTESSRSTAPVVVPARLSESGLGAWNGEGALRPPAGAELGLLWLRRPAATPRNRKRRIGGSESPLAVTSAGVLACGKTGGGIQAIDLGSNRRLWELPHVGGNHGSSDLDLAGDGLLLNVPGITSEVADVWARCVAVRDGAVVWERHLGSVAGTAVHFVKHTVIGNTFITYIDDDGVVCGWDVGSGRPLFRVDVGTGAFSHVFPLPGNRFLSTVSSKILAIDAGSGTILWACDTEDWLTHVAAAGNRVYVITKARLTALDARDGSTVWSRALKGTERGWPTAVGGGRVIVVGTSDGPRPIECYSASGEHLWRRLYTRVEEHDAPTFHAFGSTLLMTRVLSKYCWPGPQAIARLDPATGEILWAGVSEKTDGLNPVVASGDHLFWSAYGAVFDIDPATAGY